MDKLDLTWIYKLREEFHDTHQALLTNLDILQQAVINTNKTNWIKFTLAKLFGTKTSLLIFNAEGKAIPHNLIEYKSKYYYIPNENTPTDLHS